MAGASVSPLIPGQCCLLPTCRTPRVCPPSAPGLSPELLGWGGRKVAGNEFSWWAPSSPSTTGDGKWWIKPPAFQMGTSRRPSALCSEALVHASPSAYYNGLSNVPFGKLGPFSVSHFLFFHSCFLGSTPRSITCTQVPLSSSTFGGPPH